MSEQKFTVINGKVVRVGSPEEASARAFSCTMCKIREKQIEELRQEIKAQRHKIEGLKEELTRTQAARAEKREAYGAINVERLAVRENTIIFAKRLVPYLRFVRLVLWLLKSLKEHPPGGFCPICDQGGESHAQECLLAQLIDNPGQAILSHAKETISEDELPIPPELRVAEVEPLIDKPWGLYQDLKRECRDQSCSSPPLKAKLWCWQHMPKEYGR